MPDGWFGVVVTSSPVSTGIGDRPLAGLPSRYLSKPLRPTQPGHPSVGMCND